MEQRKGLPELDLIKVAAEFAHLQDREIRKNLSALFACTPEDRQTAAGVAGECEIWGER